MTPEKLDAVYTLLVQWVACGLGIGLIVGLVRW